MTSMELIDIISDICDTYALPLRYGSDKLVRRDRLNRLFTNFHTFVEDTNFFDTHINKSILFKFTRIDRYMLDDDSVVKPELEIYNKAKDIFIAQFKG
jgi:hypothetical protein